MKNSLRNLVIGAVVFVSVFAIFTTVMADGSKISQAVQNNQAAQAQADATRQYFDNNWSYAAVKMQNSNAIKTVSVESGYLALRSAPSYDAANEMGRLNNGDLVQVTGSANGSYVQVYCAKYGAYGWVNAGFLR